MNYEQWKTQYLSILKNKIKSHENSIDYTLSELDKLVNELCERGFLDEDGYWSDTTPERAAQESYQLWLDDYFIGEEEGSICNRNSCKGIISIRQPDDGSCTCFINAPCDYCCTSIFYCSECDYEETNHA